MKALLKSKPDFELADPVKFKLNCGGLLDIPTGEYVRGMKGENLLNGGHAPVVAIAGRGNCFKSTLGHHITLCGANIVAESGFEPYINTYDTEINIEQNTLHRFSTKFDSFRDIDIIESGIWAITDRSKEFGETWFYKLREFLLREKKKNEKQYLIDTPFLSRSGEPLRCMIPTFGEIDSLSMFETSASEEVKTKHNIADSSRNMINMRGGLHKSALVGELPALCNGGKHYMVMTGHIVDNQPIQQGPNQVQVKKMQHQKANDKFKGMTDMPLYLSNAFWEVRSPSIFTNDTTKGPEYPRDRSNPEAGSKDLNTINLLQHRCKSGQSGYLIELVVSQSEGILPTLSEFLYAKNRKFGINGLGTPNFSMMLLPEHKLMRTTIRSEINESKELRRAIKITADLCQIKQFMEFSLPFKVPEPNDFYEKLSKKYGWSNILNTRDYWTFNQYEHPVPYLSTLDMIEMYYDLYTPYWMQT